MVSTHAHTMLLAVIHLTLLTPRVRPVPMIAPVTVCVVETGMPRKALMMVLQKVLMKEPQKALQMVKLKLPVPLKELLKQVRLMEPHLVYVRQ